MSEKDKHKTFVWEYFDRGISKSSKGITDEAKCKKCAAVILLFIMNIDHSYFTRFTLQTHVIV